MPWDRSRPPDEKYRTKQHLQQRAEYQRLMFNQGYLVCAQPECVEDTRTILPHQAWAAGHDDLGTSYIGPVHKRCNDVDAAKRANAKRRGLEHNPPARRLEL